MAITPTSSDSSTELSGKVNSPAVFNGGDADSVSGEEVEEEVEVEEDGDEEEDPDEVLEEEEDEEVSEDGDEDDPEEVEEDDEEEVKGDGVADAPDEVAEEEEEEGGEDGEEEEEGEEDGEEEEEGEEDDEDPVEEEEVVEEEIEDVEEEEGEEVETEIAEEEEEIAEEDGEEPMEEDVEEAEVVKEEDSEEVEEEEEEEGEEEIDADGEEVVEEEVEEEAEEVKGGQEDVQEVLEEDNVKAGDDIGKKVDGDVVREEIKEGEVKEEEEEIKEMEGDGEDEIKEMEGDGEDGGVVEEEVKQEDVAMKGEEDIKVEDVGEKVEEENHGEGRKEGTDLLFVNSRDISAKIEPGGPGGPNSFSCTPERCNPSTTVVHVKDGNGGNLTVSYPSDETGSGAQMEVDMPTEPLKDVEQGHDSQIGLVSRDSVAGQYTRLDQENNTSLEKKNEHCDVLEIEAPHLHTKTDLQTREGLSLPSMHTPEKRPRSSSPDAGIKHANKRPAIICDFFARGWCIKGKSCSFLHQKEGVSNTSLQTKDVVGINRNGGFLHGTGLREDVERAKRSASQELLSNTESSSKSPLTAQKDLVRAYGEVFELPKLHYDYSMHGAHPQSIRASYAPTDDFRQPFSRDEFKRPYGPSPHIDAMGERRLAGDNLLSGRYTASHFPSQDSRTSGSMTSSLRASTHGFTRMGVEHLDARMPSDFDRGNYGYRSASLTKSISSYCSPSEVLHTAQKDVLLTGKTAEVRDAWMPSIPFRSSFCRDPTNIPSYRSQYDPVLDSITPSNVARSTFETIQNVSNGGTTPSGIHTPGYGAQQSLNSFSQHHEAVFGKSKVDHGLNGSAGTLATPEPSTVDGGSSFMSKKDEHWIPGHAVDGVNVNDAEASLGGHLKNIEDKGRNNKDSRAMKFFHCALVDFVKELVKPSWREGHLSKDAHKMVVKKAVEKVLSAIQPHQVPGNAELVNQYLSTSRSKILKLVEGYVEKYSKSGAS